MRLAVVGTGLIGASAGLAAGRACIEQVAGWDDAPLRIEGGALLPITYTLPVASAQVKSAVAPGEGE